MVASLRLLLLLWPVAEIAVLIAVADWIGIGWTLVALLGTALAGILVIRVVGAASLAELRRALERREPPAGPLMRGACGLLAGMLLILPGFIGDAVALLLLIPPLRAALLGALWRGARKRRSPGSAGGRTGGGAVIIEGEYQATRVERADPQIGAKPPADQPTPDKPSSHP
jgi:UPF0716 protein FxsA